MAGALVDRSLQVIMITAGLLAVGAALCHRGQAAVYWSGDSLGRANLDGSAALWPLPNGWNPGQGAVASYGVAVDGESLYWAEMNAGAIAGSTTDGTWPNFSLIAGLGLPSGVAVHQDKIYWSDLETGSIGRANLDGSEVDPNFISGGSRTCGVATDGHYLYWANQEAGWIGRAELDGGNVEQAFIDGLGLPCGVDVGAGYLFWGDQDLRSLGRAALDGSAVNRDFVVDAEEPWDVAVSGSHVYWAKRWGWEPGREGGLGRANIAGTEVIAQLVPGLRFVTGVAVDDRTFETGTGPNPSDYLRLGKVTHDRKRGSIRLIVHVPARGALTVDAPRIGWRIDTGNPPPWVGGAFRWRLRLWPGKGPKGKRIRRQLRRRGRAPITLRVTYQQEGRLPLQATKRLAFQRAATGTRSSDRR